MIALPSIAFGGFSGSAKDVTARHVHGRSILSCRTWPTGMATNTQLARRASLKTIAKGFKNMTDEQRRAWDVLAESAHGRSVLGQAAEISGLNLYIRLNFNRVMAGYSIITDAPETLRAVPNVIFDAAWVIPSAVIVKGIIHEALPLKLVVKMSGGQSAGVSKGWSKTVIISPGMEEDWGDADVTKLYFDTIGVEPALGEKVFVEMYWLDTDTGVTGLEVRDSMLCITEEEARAEGYVERQNYGPGDLYTGRPSQVDSFILDYSTGSPAVRVDAECTGGYSARSSTVYVAKPIPTELQGKIFLMGRAHGSDGQLFAQGIEISMNKQNAYTSMFITAQGGSGCAPYTVFGTGLLVDNY